MVEEFAVLGGPSDLHHPRRNDRHLVVPNARIHAEGAPHALKRRGVAAGLVARTKAECDVRAAVFPHRTGRKLPTNLQTSGGDLQVLADVVAVEHGVDGGQVDLLVGELTAVFQDWTDRTHGRLKKCDRAAAHLTKLGGGRSTHTGCRGSTARRIQPAS